MIVEGDRRRAAARHDPELERAFAAAAGFDPPEGYVYLRITPREIQAWREADELAGRRLMRDGAWL